MMSQSITFRIIPCRLNILCVRVVDVNRRMHPQRKPMTDRAMRVRASRKNSPNNCVLSMLISTTTMTNPAMPHPGETMSTTPARDWRRQVPGTCVAGWEWPPGCGCWLASAPNRPARYRWCGPAGVFGALMIHLSFSYRQRCAPAATLNADGSAPSRPGPGRRHPILVAVYTWSSI